jgi:hypothetical protein
LSAGVPVASDPARALGWACRQRNGSRGNAGTMHAARAACQARLCTLRRHIVAAARERPRASHAGLPTTHPHATPRWREGRLPVTRGARRNAGVSRHARSRPAPRPPPKPAFRQLAGQMRDHVSADCPNRCANESIALRIGRRQERSPTESFVNLGLTFIERNPHLVC